MQNEDVEETDTGNFWNRDLLHSKSFRKGMMVVVLLPCLALLLFSAAAIFGALATGICFILILVGFWLYDIYENKKRRAHRQNWEEGMKQDGWQQETENRWKMKYWDYYENRYVIHRYFTDGRIPKYLVTPRLNVRRHPSYIVQRRRIRRK